MSSYPPRRQSQQGPAPSQYGTNHPQSYQPHSSYGASAPREIPRQGQFGQQETVAPQYYGTTPPQFGTSPARSVSIYGNSPSQAAQMYGSTPPTQFLTPYSSQAGYPPQPQPQPGVSPQQAYDMPVPARRRASSTTSYQSHKSRKSHHSTRSKHSFYDEKGSRRKNSRVQSPRPTFGDTMVLMWGSLKGAFDTRK